MKRLLRRFLPSTAIVMLLLPAPSLHAITFGQPDGDLHPNVGTMIVEIEGERVNVCTGTLISPTVYLTAARAVETKSLVNSAHQTHACRRRLGAEELEYRGHVEELRCPDPPHGRRITAPRPVVRRTNYSRTHRVEVDVDQRSYEVVVT